MSLLARLPMFAPMHPVTLEAVARSADHVAVDDGEVVVRQGDKGDRFYAVVEGAFDIVQSGTHVRCAIRGNCFGEVALLADVPRTATITARGPGQLLAVERVAFLTAVTGSDTSAAAAWGVVNAMNLDRPPEPEPATPT
jgi:CRP-like cAMP-binding protein